MLRCDRFQGIDSVLLGAIVDQDIEPSRCLPGLRGILFQIGNGQVSVYLYLAMRKTWEFFRG